MATEISRKNEWFKRSITSGAIAGIIFLIPQMLLLPLFSEHGPWTFLAMVAALVLNEQQVLSSPMDFDAGVVLTGFVFHMALSLLYSILFVYASGHLQKMVLIISGIFYGGFLYAINFYVFTYAFEWFIDIRGGITILAHLLYGLTIPVAYLQVHKPGETYRVEE